MRDTPDGTCPECGWVLEVGVLASNAEQRRAILVMCAWPTTFLLAIAIGLAFSALGWKASWVPDIILGQVFAAVVLSLVAYGLLGIGALVRHRGRAFRRAHRWLWIGWILLALLCVLIALSQPIMIARP